MKKYLIIMKKYLIFIMKKYLIIISFLFLSCVSNKASEIHLDTEFPNPYDENGNLIVTLVDDNTVQMPLWYWLKIVEYQIDMETNKTINK